MSENFRRIMRSIAVVILLIFTGLTGFSQISSHELAGQVNTINSAVPFLTITPDSRGGAMGDIGAATSPDISSQHHNPAKYAFIDGDGGVALSYTPWLRNLIADINLAYLVGYKRLDVNQVISGSFRYFSLGNIVFTDQEGNNIKDFNPNEYALDAGYSRLFGNNISGGIAFRFIRSDLTGGINAGDAGTKAGISVSADLSTYYQKKIYLSGKDAMLGIGANISNIGTKISYTENQEKSFIPINLRLGSSLKFDIDEYNTFTFSADINKLLVPTTPIYFPGDSTDASGNQVIQYGMNPDVSVPQGMLQSFFDAPGVENADGTRNIFREELREISYGLGGEYWYHEQFAIRGGYFYEHATKGNRKFFTFGVGLKLNVFEIDFSYLVANQTNPLANTLRFTLGFDFEKFRKNN